MTTFKLLFRGNLSAGIDQQDCINTLAQRLKTTPETIQQRFFQRWPVTVLETDSESKARRVQQVFLEAGAQVDLQSINAPQSNKPVSTTATSTPRRSHQRWPIVVGALVVLSITALVIAGWYTRPLWQSQPHPGVQQAEAALASEDLLMLAELDVRRLVDIEQRFMTVADPDALPGAGSDLMSDLARVGIDLRRQLNTVMFAAYQGSQDGSEKLEFAAVLLGQFEPGALKALIARRYQLDESRSRQDRLVFTSLDSRTCERSGVLVMLIEPDRLLLGSEARVSELSQRFQQSRPAQADLSAWRRYRGGKLASATVFAPAAVTDSSSGLSGMMLRGASKDLGPLTAAFFGVTSTTMPPGIQLEALVSGSDGGALDQNAQALQAKLDILGERLARHQPETATLLQRVAVIRSADQLGVSLALDGNVEQELSSLITAMLDQMFSFSSSKPGEPAAPRQEKLQDNPVVFQREFDPASLPGFMDVPDENFHATWSQGPVALKVKEIGVDSDAGTSYLVLTAQGRELANVGAEQGGELVISEIYNQQGEAIMPTPSCGHDRNQDPSPLKKTMDGSYFAEGEFRHYLKHEADKKVHLGEGVTLDQVARVEGRVTVQVATRTETVRIPVPAGGASVARAGARVAFGDSDEQALSFVTSGEVARILAVRALNDEGKPLASQSHSSFGPILNTGRAHQYDYHGTPASVEVVFASELQPQSYPFVLDSVQPWQDDRFAAAASRLPHVPSGKDVTLALQQPLPGDIGVYETYGNPIKGIARSGPIQLAVSRLQTGGFRGFYSQWDVRSANLPGLEGNRVAGQIQLNSIVDSRNQRHPLVAQARFGLEQKGMIFNGEFRPSQSFLSGNAAISYQDYQGADPVRLEGEVILRIPEKMAVLERPLALGETVLHGPVSVSAQAVSENALRLLVAKGIGQLAAVEVFDENGIAVGGNVQAWGDDEDNVRVNVSLSGIPAVLKLHVIETSRALRYPFTLSLNQDASQ